jgi:hypothetical protein
MVMIWFGHSRWSTLAVIRVDLPPRSSVATTATESPTVRFDRYRADDGTCADPSRNDRPCQAAGRLNRSANRCGNQRFLLEVQQAMLARFTRLGNEN